MAAPHPSRRLGLALALAAASLASAAGAARADEPSDRDLVLAGAAMAIPTYFLGVTWHEGSHALTAKAYGAEIVQFRVLPGSADGHFYFGYTRWQGQLSPCQRARVLIAPKVTDMVLLSGFAALVGFGGLPDNRYGALALTVLATGAWVDFSKDILAWSPTNDTIKVHALYGRTRERQRLPYRLLHVGLSAATGWFVFQGYREVFAGDDAVASAQVPFVVPLLAGSF